MKKVFSAMILMLALCSSMMAQDNKRGERREFNPEEMVKRQTERMAEQLTLTDEQKAAVLELNKKYSDKMGMRPMRPQGDAKQERPSKEDMEKMQTERAETQKAYNIELQKILTKEQYTKYEENMKQMRQRGGFQRGGGPRGHRGEGPRGNFNFGQDNGSTTTESDNTNGSF